MFEYGLSILLLGSYIDTPSQITYLAARPYD